MGSETNAPSVEVGAVSGNGAAAVELETESSRRALLKGLGVAAAGAVVGGVLSPTEAEAHGTFHQDSNNQDPAIHGSNTSIGAGVEGDSNIGFGVVGRSDSGPGVTGSSNSAFGMDGRSESSIGVRGFSVSGTGMVGSSLSGPGVTGNGGSVGVEGRSISGIGVQAQTFDGGTALNVIGPAKFSTAGSGTIPAQQNAVAVNDPAVTADSHITMTLTGNPGSVGSGLPAVVVWIERQPGTGFTARLSRKVTNATPFTYLIVEPG